MKNNKILNEQNIDSKSPQRDILLKAKELGCYPTWLKDGNVGDYKGNKVFYGKNTKNESVVFYSDMTVENIVTKNKGRWNCDFKQPEKFSKILEDFISSLKTTYGQDNIKKYNEITPADATTGKFTLTNLKDFVSKNFPDRIDVIDELTRLKTPLMVYTKIGGVTSSKKEKFGSELSYDAAKQAGYKEMTLDKLPEDVKSQYSCVFVTNEQGQKTQMCREILKTKGKTYTDLIKYRDEVAEKDPSGDDFITSCENLVNTYFIAAGEPKERQSTKSPLPLNKSDLESVKVQMRSCKGVFKKKWKLFTGDIQKKYDSLVYLPPFETAGKEMISYQIRERVEKNTLDKIVKENLMEMSVVKSNTLISETKIVKSRLNILTENVSLSSDKDKEKIFNKLITETIYLKSQGYNKELINESLWDMLKGVFGSSFEGVGQYFKEYMAKWLITKLTPIDPEGWIGGIIIRAFGNLRVSDINKLTDCDFLSRLLTKSIVEEIIQKLKTKAGMTGAFYDILRNAVVESLDDSEFGQKIESGIAEIICPLVGGIAKKMETKSEEMKNGAINA
jgi:hypothetical protein